jgi:hypothetical protein
MKAGKWLIVGLILLSFGILIGSGIVDDKLIQSIKLPFGWGDAQVQAEHPFLHRPGMLLASIGALFTLSLSSILVVYSIPMRIRRMADSIPNKWGGLIRLTLVGLLIEILVLTIGISSALMIGTFPLTILLIGGWFITSFIGLVALAFSLGRGLLRRTNWRLVSPLFPLLLGILSLFTLIRIPFLGGVFLVLFTSLGVGNAIVTHFGTGQDWNLNSLTEEVPNEKVV